MFHGNNLSFRPGLMFARGRSRGSLPWRRNPIRKSESPLSFRDFTKTARTAKDNTKAIELPVSEIAAFLAPWMTGHLSAVNKSTITALKAKSTASLLAVVDEKPWWVGRFCWTVDRSKILQLPHHLHPPHSPLHLGAGRLWSRFWNALIVRKSCRSRVPYLCGGR